MRQRWSLDNVVAWAWVPVLMVGLLLPSITKTDPPLHVRLLLLIVIPAGLLALPVALVGSLVLVVRRWLGRPRTEQAADYDDADASVSGSAANGPAD